MNVDIYVTNNYTFFNSLSLIYRYDYHRGIDIPADLYSEVYAVSDGTVRINGSHHAYSDGVVQVISKGVANSFRTSYMEI